LIQKVRFSQCVKFFEKGFVDKWGLEAGYSHDEPMLFVGAYTIDDIKTILEHKHRKVVMLLGADMPNIDKLKNDKSITFVSDKQLNIDIFSQNNVTYFDKVLPLKDFSAFKPTPKGDRPYCYVNQWEDNNLIKHRWHLAEKYNPIAGIHGKTQAEVITDYYTPAFINFQLNPYAGFTSAIEMAYMGRKSISNSPAPFCIPFNKESDIQRIIDIERDTDWNVDLVGDYLYHEKDWLDL